MTNQEEMSPKLWAVWAVRAGCGRTTVATNVAALLGELENGPRVLLIDGDLGFGDLDLHLGMRPGHRLPGLAARYMHAGNVLKSADLVKHSAVWEPGRHLSVLAGIERAEQAGRPCLRGEQGAQFAQALLSLAREQNDLVMVDTGPSANSFFYLAVLQEADRILVVVTPDRCVLMQTRAMLDVLCCSQGIERSRFVLVVNEWSPDCGLQLAEIAQFVDVRELLPVPLLRSGGMMRAVNEGVPFAVAPGRRRSGIRVREGLAALAAFVYPPFGSLVEVQ